MFSIHIEIKGRAKVRWSEQKSRSTSDGKTEYYTVNYTGDEQYLSSRTYVAGGSGGNSFEFPAGTHTYDFQVVLPTGIPSSVEGQYGNIRYEVIVTVDRPWRFDNTFKRLFSVIEHQDLNHDPSNKVPIRQEDIKTFCWGCCSDDFVKTSCLIPFSAYAPGQKIPFHILIENSSSSEVYRTKIKLEKIVTFTVTSPERKTRREATKILEKEFGGVLKLSNKDFNDFMQLPSIPPSSSQTSHIINVSYWITVKGYISGCTSDAELYFPIKIGTVPLLESATNPASIVTVQPSAPGKEDLPPAYIAQNPPSYEDALGLGEQTLADDEEDSHVKKEPFVPKYPVFYNFAAPTAPPVDINLPSAPPAFTNNGSASTSVNPESANLLPYPTSNTGPPVPTTNDNIATYGWKAT